MQDTNNSWLHSDSLIKRSLAVYGHCLLGQLVVGAAFLPLIFAAFLVGFLADPV